MDNQLTHVAGKNIEDLTTKELESIAAEAGRKAILNAKKRGSRFIEWQDNQLVWIYPDGHKEPVED